MTASITRRRLSGLGLGVGLGALLGGCAQVPPPPGGSQAWHAVPIPGKRPTRYERVLKEGRPAWHAKSAQSASMWRQRVERPADRLGEVSFAWWVDAVVPGGHVAERDSEDAAARVLFAFGGDVSRLPARTRSMFELAQALTGEMPPYATLMYVWDTTAPVGSLIVNPRSDRIRKIVLDSGSRHVGQWRVHRRDLAADFRRAFGEPPGPLTSVAVMTDSDNTASQAASWYADIEFH